MKLRLHSDSIRFSTFRLLTVLLIGITLFGCDKNSGTSTSVQFLILDERTFLPVANVSIQLLEDGVIATTNDLGTAIFEESDLTSPIMAIPDSVSFAFSITHEDYIPRELNAGDGELVVYLTPDTVQSYTYHKPVQLDDGLSTANIITVGADTVKIHALMEKISKKGYRELHSVLVYKDNQLILEEYYFGNNDTIQFENNILRDRSPEDIQWSRKGKHYVASVNKAFTSTIAGIALDAYGLTTDTPIKDYLPEYANYFESDANKSALTYHHALNMTLGFQWNEWSSNDLSLLWKSDDFADFLLSRQNFGPGSAWVYNSASPNLVLKSLENMVGEPIRDWADTNFYSRLGITDYVWQSQPDGYPEGAARMYLRPRDMLKLGVVYLNEGKWNGEQVVPAAWVTQAFEVEEATSSGDYSHHFWIRSLEGSTYLSADGDGGNFINIFPEENMVIVITQGNYLEWPFYVNQANNIMGNYLIPALK